MADFNDNRKLILYRALYRLNRGFTRIHNNLGQLIAAKTLQEEFAEVWQNRLGETQAEINKRLTGILNAQEQADTRRLGIINEHREEVRLRNPVRKKSRH